MRTTAIFNLKGGVAKTISTAAMADILAIDHKKRVLVIDADGQGNLSQYFGVDAQEGASTLDLLNGTHEPVYSDWVTPARPDADIVHGAWNFIGPDGALQRPMKALPYSLNMHIWYGTYLASTALFLRRSTTIEEGFLLDERFRYDMDGEYYARLGRAGKKFVHYNRLLADFRWHGDNLSAPNVERRDMDAELKRQKQHSEDAAIKRVYGYSFSKQSCNNILDGFMREAYRMKKAFLYLTTPWEK